jgi:uncharacterized membrane protein HdeD (DUF308 family)
LTVVHLLQHLCRHAVQLCIALGILLLYNGGKTVTLCLQCLYASSVCCGVVLLLVGGAGSTTLSGAR